MPCLVHLQPRHLDRCPPPPLPYPEVSKCSNLTGGGTHSAQTPTRKQTKLSRQREPDAQSRDRHPTRCLKSVSVTSDDNIDLEQHSHHLVSGFSGTAIVFIVLRGTTIRSTPCNSHLTIPILELPLPQLPSVHHPISSHLPNLPLNLCAIPQKAQTIPYGVSPSHSTSYLGQENRSPHNLSRRPHSQFVNSILLQHGAADLRRY